MFFETCPAIDKIAWPLAFDWASSVMALMAQAGKSELANQLFIPALR
jgi:hypothetical protein